MPIHHTLPQPMRSAASSIARAFPFAAPLLLAVTATALALAPASWPLSSIRNQGAPALPASAPCASDVIALLGGLRSGDLLSSWRVTGIDCGQPRAASVTIDRSGSSLKLIVTPTGSSPNLAPARTARYDIFYGRVGPDPRMPADTDLRALLDALASRVRAAETHAPRPSSW